MRLSKAASDRKLSVCLCKNVGNTGSDIFGAKASCEKAETAIDCNCTLLQIFRFFTGLNGKIEWGEQGPCTRLNREIEWFLHKSE